MSEALRLHQRFKIEIGGVGVDWAATTGELRKRCAATTNESGLVYRVVRIGFESGFFESNKGVFRGQSGRLHLKNDVAKVSRWLKDMNESRALHLFARVTDGSLGVAIGMELLFTTQWIA